MAKQLRDVLKGVKSSKVVPGSTGTDPGVDYAPKAGDERKFVAKHSTEKHDSRVGNRPNAGDATKEAKFPKQSKATYEEVNEAAVMQYFHGTDGDHDGSPQKAENDHDRILGHLAKTVGTKHPVYKSVSKDLKAAQRAHHSADRHYDNPDKNMDFKDRARDYERSAKETYASHVKSSKLKEGVEQVDEALGTIKNMKAATKFTDSNVNAMIRNEKARKASQKDDDKEYGVDADREKAAGKDKKKQRDYGVKEEAEQVDEARSRTDTYIGTVHKDDPDYDQKLSDMKKLATGGSRVRGRLGKNNPNSKLYATGGPLKSFTSQDIKPEHGSRVDVYSRKVRKEEAGDSIDRGYKPKEDKMTLGRVARAAMTGITPVVASAAPLATALVTATTSPANKDEPDYVKQNMAAQKQKDMNRDRQGMKAESLDPVGREDDDIDNDGRKNTKTDKYLSNRRKVIAAAIGGKKKVAESKDDHEYGYEGEMAISQIKSIMNHSKQLLSMLEPDTDLPEWVQSKITLASDYMQTAADYMQSEMSESAQIEEAEQVEEQKNQYIKVKNKHTGAVRHIEVHPSRAFEALNKYKDKNNDAQIVTKKPMKEDAEQIDEVLTKKDKIGTWISDFVHSKNPKFAGKSKKDRMKQAIAAYYAKQRNEEVGAHIHETEEVIPPKGKKLLKEAQKCGKCGGSKFKSKGKQMICEQCDTPMSYERGGPKETIPAYNLDMSRV